MYFSLDKLLGSCLVSSREFRCDRSLFQKLRGRRCAFLNRHLRYFVTVAEEQNVSRAAKRLHVSQPPLSRQIRDLEKEVSIALLERSAKAIRLTEVGQIFLSEARAALQRVDDSVVLPEPSRIANGITSAWATQPPPLLKSFPAPSGRYLSQLLRCWYVFSRNL